MSKSQNKPHRTRPLDRDGDGADGGSLPGNETAPMATGDATETAAGDSAAAAETAPQGDAAAPETAAEGEDGAAETAPTEDGDTPETASSAEADDGKTDAAADDDAGETFTADEVAAGAATVVQEEGEATTTAAEADAPAEADLVAAEGEDPLKAPVAVRVDELRRLVDNRWLYRTRDGYSASYAPPYVSHDTVKVWIEAGLAEDRPSAGREGGVFVTHKARLTLAGARRAAAETDAA